MREKVQQAAILLSLRIDDPGRNEILITPPHGIPVGGLKDTGSTSGQTILRYGMTIFIITAILLSLFFLIWGGISWITSGGDKNKIQAARMKIIYAIVGLLIVFLSFFIVQFLGSLLGIDIFCTGRFCRTFSLF